MLIEPINEKSSTSKTAPDVFYKLFEKVNHKKATRFNGYNLKIPKVNTESAKRTALNGVENFNTLLMHFKKEKFYLPFKQRLEEIIYF